MPWRKAVTTVSSNIFPSVTNVGSSPDIGTYEASANMPLQMLLFFNVFLFPFWFITTSTFLYIKFECLGHLTRFLSVAVLTMSSSIEGMRLYLGYIGNLSERIPELAGFWMLSVLLQLPLQTFHLVNPFLRARPTELVLHATMWLLLAAQLGTGLKALRMAAARAQRHCALRAHLRELPVNTSANAPSEDKSKIE